MLDTSRGVTRPVREPEPVVGASARRQYAPLVLPAVTMAVLGCWRLGRDNAMGNDEVATRWISGLGLHSMAHVLDRLDAVHGLYYLIIHGWSLFGNSPTAIRVPSVLAMIAAVVVIGAIGVRLTGSSLVATMSGLVAALTPSIGFYAQTARSYALVYLAVALATLALLRALEAESRVLGRTVLARRWAAYSLFLVLSAYLNELSLLVLGAHLVTVAVARPRLWGSIRWSLSAMVAVVAAIPLIAISRRESQVLDYLRAPGLDDLRVLFHTYFAGSVTVGIVLAAVAVVGMFARSARRGATSGDTATVGQVSLVSVALPLAVVPAGLLLAYSQWFRPLYADRYVLFGEIGVALLVGAGLERLAGLAVRSVRHGRHVRAPVLLQDSALRWTPALLACVCVFVFQLGSQHSARRPMSRQFDFGGPAGVVQADARDGDGVLFFDSFYRRARLGYPDAFRGVSDFAMAVSPARSGTFRGTDKPFSEIAPLMLERHRIWVIGKAPGATRASAPSIRDQAALLTREFALVSRHRFGRITVTLWRRR